MLVGILPPLLYSAAYNTSFIDFRANRRALISLSVGLVIFTTFQSFAVFARIIEGAWLFVILGVVFLATGFLADRARRRLAIELEGEAS